jgi:hypothetical protein
MGQVSCLRLNIYQLNINTHLRIRKIDQITTQNGLLNYYHIELFPLFEIGKDYSYILTKLHPRY